MASVLLKVPVYDGPSAADSYIVVEVDQRDVGDAVQLTADRSSGYEIATARQSLIRGLDQLLPALNTMLLKLRSAEQAPDEIAMEFGLKIGGEAGFIFTKGTAEATFKVHVAWAKPTVPVPDGGERGPA